VAVDQMTFTAAGSVTALSAQRSGKTTVMLMLASLLRPDLGQLRWPAHRCRPVQTPPAWLDADTFGSYDNLTAVKCWSSSPPRHRIARAARTARARELLALAPGGIRHAPVHCSPGQKQRLACAAIVHSPTAVARQPASG